MELEQAYDTLLLPMGASLEEVKHAFHSEARIVHPDTLTNMPPEVIAHATERFKQINEAYQSLTEHIAEFGVPKGAPTVVEDPIAKPEPTVVPTDEERNPPPSGMSKEEALGMFMAGELRRKRGLEAADDVIRQTSWWKILLIFVVAISLLKSCLVGSRHSSRQPRRTTTEQVQPTEQTP